MLSKGVCLSTNDTLELVVKNVIGTTLNMATTNIVANWSVTGPVNSSGVITVNSGTLAPNATTTLMATTVNLSVPGVYTYNAYLQPSSFNLLGLNDTLAEGMFTVYPVWEVTPKSDTLYTLLDSADLEVKSPYLSAGDFFITEICHFAGASTGTPSGGKPSWLLADDYLEITGVPGADLGGITLEQWSTTAIMSNFTFLPGTVLSPNGTAIIAIGQLGSSVESPANFYYHGTGSFTGLFSSGGANGRILKDSQGAIVDAVGSAATYVFPTTTGVTSADWSSSAGMGSHTSTWGIRLEGPDLNGATGWIVSSSANPQNPNAINNLVQVPNAGSTAGFSWSKVVNGALVQVDTLPAITIGESSAGVFYYVASLTNACGTFTDTVTIYSFIAGCSAPTNTAVTAGCKDATVTWIDATGTTTSSIEYGLAGFTLGTGTVMNGVTSPSVITGLLPNTAYDFYLVSNCSSGSAAPVKVTKTTVNNPTTASFTWMQTATTMTNATVDFDASGSVNGTTYTWDFGDGSTAGTGVTPTHQYTANGAYYVTATVEGPCVTDMFGDTVLVSHISVEEVVLKNSLNIYPNPNGGIFNVEFNVEGSKVVTIRVVSVLGDVVYQNTPAKITGAHREEINLESKAAGVYLIQIISDGNVASKRITIQH